ncbi:hypothetical protein [Actinomadura sp. 9N215]|uniref:hypothetical protein n=1 Tax=Actinomadura sp. 9N215 TaxID=3375150 RepID=UPI00378FA0A9
MTTCPGLWPTGRKVQAFPAEVLRMPWLRTLILDGNLILERFLFLDDEDRKLIAKRRGTTVSSGSLSRYAPCAISAGSSQTTRWTCRGS